MEYKKFKKVIAKFVSSHDSNPNFWPLNRIVFMEDARALRNYPHKLCSETNSIIDRKSCPSNYAINRLKTKLLSRGRASTTVFGARNHMCRKFVTRLVARRSSCTLLFAPWASRSIFCLFLCSQSASQGKREKEK